MNAIMNWLEKYVVPVAAKIGSIRWLVALRDSFIATLPITMAGSLAVLLNAILQTYPAQWGWTGVVNAAQPLIMIDNTVSMGSLNIFAIFFAVMWGYHLASAYKVDGVAGALVSVSAFFMGINATAQVALGKKLSAGAAKILTDAGVTVSDQSITVGNAFTTGHLGSASLFTAMIFGALAMVVYIYLMKKDISIKMPDTVPPAVSKAFVSLIPAIAALYVISIVNYLFTWGTGQVFGDWLSEMIQAPLLHAGQSAGMVLLVTFLVQLLWFFGIHGSSVLQPVLDSIWQTSQLANIAALQNHDPLPYKWVRGSWDAFAWYGGAGGTIILLIAILWVSKRADEKTVAKLAFVPGLFNINEPVMFGLPVVLNAIYFIPFLLAPLVNTAVAYVVTMLGWVAPVQIAVPWITPPILDAWMATNFDFRAIILAVFNMIVAFFIWLPFVMASSRMQNEELTE
ncbi:MAG: PTS sugar transporter subunit IIC [Lactobacillus sp.]|jgi:PTS system cellobiose-specific IIC component|uniref:PTS sugar transporter subunit IIC n=1 Tax=Lacticaseibacillus suilingensis TaxID=2799577 RepID=UPI0022E8897B|nr:PTS sugar transporter subunit IIC [Lacticaseibacillus suilingensis]MCI1893746.1 PTS sugar transporter subunit IIC [Lactobacillus sp.]MCI1916704.1 PTS sugar transporter subunit IIC [Lactobacillus sp.]MCI1941381.1 PTS sugar transporter subunit IIC [Lactobacillus sp.]MCI1971926.1 PTS sugar transporter subunit IIC [Lactobacillus sp.]MCI2016567.1 PTS sugar transporter subunit IIC [Lactobacillus sp.]